MERLGGKQHNYLSFGSFWWLIASNGYYNTAYNDYFVTCYKMKLIHFPEVQSDKENSLKWSEHCKQCY